MQPNLIQIPTLITNSNTPELIEVLSLIQSDIQNLIPAQDSPLGDLDAILNTIQYNSGEYHNTLIITFDITQSQEYYQDSNEDLDHESFKAIELAAHEACTFCLPKIISNQFDINPALIETKYMVTRSSLVFLASINN